MPHYSAAVLVYAASAVAELASEPLWVVSQIHLRAGLKVMAEGLAPAARCFATVGLLYAWGPTAGLRIFCAAQLVHTGALGSGGCGG